MPGMRGHGRRAWRAALDPLQPNSAGFDSSTLPDRACSLNASALDSLVEYGLRSPTKLERGTVDSANPRSRVVATQEPIPALLDAIAPGVSHKGALSPKRPAVETSGLADVFPYYAGFSFDWACGQLARWRQDTQDAGLVLDPWNGSGTTTLAAQYLGLNSVGIDRNPVANVVAKLRAEAANVSDVDLASPSENVPCAPDDPLRRWFGEPTVQVIRNWVSAIEKRDSSGYSVSMVALFRAVRILTKKFEVSNPTWVKAAKNPEDVVFVTLEDFDELVHREADFIISRARAHGFDGPRVTVVTADSSNLPLASKSVDIVLTSPPYLTRIDYGVAYARELAVLGIDVSTDRQLRSELMGTTLIRPDSKQCLMAGRVASELLTNISAHRSKASSGYYLKQARQYIDDLRSGLDEITRVCKKSAVLQLVVQDSFYKEIHVPLAEICIDEANIRGWKLSSQERFPVRRSITTMNSSAKMYKKGDVEESVITFDRSTDV